jgi:two-component system sensor histidine kinase PilS (NtrC family)
MHSESSSNLYPCPFSKNYSIPKAQAWNLLKVFFSYRLLIACLFIVLYFGVDDFSGLRNLNKSVFFIAAASYLGLVLLSGFLIYWPKLSYTTQAQLTIFVDIVCLTLLMHACGGINSGIGILLVISIAAGGMLVGGRCAFLFAALASLAVLSEQVYAILNNGASTSSLTYSGMLGASYFTIALLAVVMAQRTEKSEQLAHEQQKTIVQLEELNQHIIQYMQSGILIVDEQLNLQLFNQAALKLLGYNDLPENLADLDKSLQVSLTQWLKNPGADFYIVLLNNGQEVQMRLSALKIADAILYMIILEDIILYNQRLQQSKLASLGRLTASMAHEIRNPLGAISHAVQLLSEAPGLSSQDKRLTEIIHVHSQRVNGIIESILHLSRRKTSQQSVIALEEWLISFCQQWQEEQAVNNILTLKMPDQPVKIAMDEGHLRQILQNLCNNALKYGGQIEQGIEIEVEAEQNLVQIHVMNKGGEIPAHDQQHLFEPFFTTSASGTGLGLYICRELAALNRAELHYTYRDYNNDFVLIVANAEQPTLDV